MNDLLAACLRKRLCITAVLLACSGSVLVGACIYHALIFTSKQCAAACQCGCLTLIQGSCSSFKYLRRIRLRYQRVCCGNDYGQNQFERPVRRWLWSLPVSYFAREACSFRSRSPFC